MTRRPLLAVVLSAVLTVPLGVGVGAASAAPPPEPPPSASVPVVHGRDLTPPKGPEKVSPSLSHASGQVTAFVQLDAKSRLDTTEGGGSRKDADAAAAKVEDLAAQVVPSTTARAAAAAPRTLAVTSALVAGIVVAGDASRVRALADKADVVAVYLIVPKKIINKGTDVFTGALDAWTSAGATGDGVTIGVVDTGLDYTHADFGGPGTAEAYAAAYGTDGTGPIPAGSFDGAKFLGGHDFAGPHYDADPASTTPGATTTPSPDDNPIDSVDGVGGHGTHVSGTAAGYGVQADGTTFTGDYATLTDLNDWKIGPGSAPRAGIYSLKVFGDQGGSTGLVIDALEWAADPNGDGDLNDHLDIINMSLGSDTSPADDPENLFVDKLAQLGVLSVVASGNAGDVTDIGGSPGNAASALTVANSISSTQTFDAVEVTAATDTSLLGLHAAQNSVSYTGTADVTAPVAFLGADVTGCSALTASAPAITGKIVYLYWDDNDLTRECGSARRFNNAQAAGAVGVLLGSTLSVFTAGIAGNAGIPGAQLTGPSTTALLPEIQAGTLTVHLGPSLANAAFATNPQLADTLNDSSSRGVHGSLGIVKPDVAAPGTLISSASSGSGGDRSTKSGTSMATPHVAGIAALVAGQHPGWDAYEIKAAVMNTATHDVYSQPGQTGLVFGPERVGSGRVDAFAAAQDDVVAYNTDDHDLVSVTFGVVPVGDTTVVQHKTVTVRNDSSSPVTYGTSFVRATSAGGATITVTPASLTVPAGGTGLVSLTLTADPTTLAKDLDPTMEPSYDLGIPVPRDYVATLSGRLVLTPAGGSELRVPVQAAPRLVSDLASQPVQFADAGATSAPLTLTGRGVDSGGWTSLVAPMNLVAESPVLAPDTGVGTSGSSIAAADLRYVGFASTAPQLVAAGADPAVSGHGTIGIGIATQGEWATLGTNVIPVIDTDIDKDGVWDLETIVRKYDPSLDFTVVETFALVHEGGDSYSLGDLLDLSPVNGVWADTDTTVFDNDVVVATMSLDAVGIAPGDVPTFAVSTASPYATGGGSVVDSVDPFTADPYAPAFWFDAGAQAADSLWFVGAPGTPFTVQRSRLTGDGQLLLLHSHNAAGQRAEVVDVTAPVPAATSTTLTVGGTLVEGSQQKLTATVAPPAATGTVTFLDGTTTLGTAPVTGGVATLTVALATGSHSLTAAFAPSTVDYLGSTSAPVVVDIAARQASTLTVLMPTTVQQGQPVPVAVVIHAGARPTGTVEVWEGTRRLAAGTVHVSRGTGYALVTLPRGLALGVHHLTVTYSGNAAVAPSSVTRDLTVVARHHRFS